jgi:N-acyl homoserine lactone hydrolase
MKLNRRHAARAWRLAIVLLCIGVTAQLLGSGALAQTQSKPAVRDVRVYVFDCGISKMNAAGVKQALGFDPEKISGPLEFALPCFLIAHPRGTLMWDTGAVPDEAIGKGGGNFEVSKTLTSQLAAIGYAPKDITYLALSHYHADHTGNANLFAGSTWLTPKAERDWMFAEKPKGFINPAHYSMLKDAKTIILDKDEHDVFGDGKVILKAAPGHTPGNQVLLVKLAKTGPLMLSGDLYHYNEERTLGWVPLPLEFNAEQSKASRVVIEDYVKKMKAQLWIGHDLTLHNKLKISPAYYD